MQKRKRSLILDTHVILSFIPVFIISLVFFVLILEMVDLFSNLIQYLQNNIPFSLVLKSLVLYIPACIVWALPIATLFSITYILGAMYANNELIVVFGSGISFASFIMPLVVLSFILSLGFFVFSDQVVIPKTIEKKVLVKTMLKTGENYSVSNFTVVGKNRHIAWNVQYFDKIQNMMSGVVVLEVDDEGKFVSRINAQSAQWTGTLWQFSAVRRFFWKDGYITESSHASWEDSLFDENPDSFFVGNKSIDDMNLKEAKKHIEFLKKSNLPASAALAEYYKRFAFALTPFAVTLMSLAFAGLFRKNILLMSLLLSLIAATVYYSAQLVFMLMAKAGAINPMLGAFAPIFICTILVVGLFKLRRV